jgi:hypothetical protein
MELRDAVSRATSWADVLWILDLSDNGDNRTTVKAHAVRLGLDVSHLMAVSADVELADNLFLDGAQPAMLRVAAPLIASAWFAIRGMPVAVPTEPEVYDLLVTMPRHPSCSGEEHHSPNVQRIVAGRDRSVRMSWTRARWLGGHLRLLAWMCWGG